MSEVFRCIDRLGREVVLTEQSWQRKILADHIILRGHEECVQITLMDPYRIMRDATNPQRECFYRHRTLPGMPDKLLKVVVEYAPSGPSGILIGRVVTAYPTNRFKTGESQPWPS